MENTNQFTSLQTIRDKRAELQKQLEESETEIKGLWDGLFHREEVSSLSPTQKFLSFATSSAGIIDGVLFGWKLYRRFKRR